MSGPLKGLRIVEMAGLGPAPFAGMMFADHGAEVIRIDRPETIHQPHDPLLRSRKSVILDLKKSDDVATLRRLCCTADGLIEGFRPGVMERLGLGPEILLEENPQLVYGRMTGWGQHGPMAALAGHDINYISIAGVLGAIGRAGERPVPPINLAGDFGGGAMMLCFGMLSALLHVRAGGKGQVIDCAMTDGSALLMSMMWGFLNDGSWRDERGVNLLDSGAPYYDTYETADGGFVSIGSIEPKFYELLRSRTGTEDDAALEGQNDRDRWPEQKARMAELFRTRSRDEWAEMFSKSDACISPVLSMQEALTHPHNVARGTFIDVAGDPQPGPAPRYSATVCDPPTLPPFPGEHTEAVIKSL